MRTTGRAGPDLENSMLPSSSRAAAVPILNPPGSSLAPGRGAEGQQWRKSLLFLHPSLEEGAGPSPIHRPSAYPGPRCAFAADGKVCFTCSSMAMSGRGRGHCLFRQRCSSSGMPLSPGGDTQMGEWLQISPSPLLCRPAQHDSAEQIKSHF